MSGPGFKTRRRRSAIRVAACMLVGCLLAVASAWATALWSPTSGPSLVPGKQLGTYVFASFEKGVGVRVDYSQIEIWPPGVNRGVTDRLRSGWPLPAFECRVIHEHREQIKYTVRAEQMGRGWQGRIWLLDGITIPQGSVLRPIPRRYLPVRPLPVGLAVNTAFLAGGLWFALFGWRVIRRAMRTRRGQCASCGYPVPSAQACPECGAPARSTTAPSPVRSSIVADHRHRPSTATVGGTIVTAANAVWGLLR